jgi:hypothetical protein
MKTTLTDRSVDWKIRSELSKSMGVDEWVTEIADRLTPDDSEWCDVDRWEAPCDKKRRLCDIYSRLDGRTNAMRAFEKMKRSGEIILYSGYGKHSRWALKKWADFASQLSRERRAAELARQRDAEHELLRSKLAKFEEENGVDLSVQRVPLLRLLCDVYEAGKEGAR